MRYIVPSMTVGAVVVRDQSLRDRSRGGRQVNRGRAGRDFLSRYVVEIDFGTKHVRLHAPGTPVPQAIPFVDAAEGLIRIAVTIDGKEIPAVLDLGASMSIINTRAGGEPPADGGQRSMAYGADGNPVPIAPKTFDVKLGGHDLGTTRLFVGDLAVFPQLGLGDGPAAIVGLDLLGHGVVWIDFAARQFALVR